MEAWLRGPLKAIAPLLMPAAHALVQAREDIAFPWRQRRVLVLEDFGVAMPAEGTELAIGAHAAIDEALR